MLNRVLRMTLLLCLSLAVSAVHAEDRKESSASLSLRAFTWQWTGLTDPMDKVQIGDPSRYTLTLAGDGAVQIRADCNRAAGTYKAADDGSISIQIDPMTKAMCPPESHSDRFVANLLNASHYFFRDGHLFLDMMAGGGTMEFLPDVAVHYRCDDGALLTVVFVKDEPPTAEIETDSGKTLLALTPTASGAKYVNGDTSFWTKGAEAVYETAGKTVNCTVVSDPPRQ